MGSERKCAFRCVTWLIVVVLCLIPDSRGQQVVSKSTVLALMCHNGSYSPEGRCICNPGYSEYQGNCLLQSVNGETGVSPNACPAGTVLWNGFCHYESLPPMRDVVPPQEKLIVVPPLRIDIPTPELIDPLDPNEAQEEPEGDEPEVIGPPGEGHSLNLNFQRVVSNNNVLNNATSVHTHNVNNVVVHFSRRTPNGGIRTVVIRNNETTVYDDRETGQKGETATKSDCDDQPVTTEAPTRDPPCCTVVSPRVCRKQGDEWVCFHRKHNVCSTICTAEVMYLRPRKPAYREPWLVMPPRQNRPTVHSRQRCRRGRCPRLDCSGCMHGSVRCHPACSTYDCMMDNSCHFIDKDLICPDASNDLCILLDQRTIDLMNPTVDVANE